MAIYIQKSFVKFHPFATKVKVLMNKLIDIWGIKVQ